METGKKSISEGNATILVRFGTEDSGGDFMDWLKEEGFERWQYSKGYLCCDWVWVNLDNMLYARGMPGIKVTGCIRDHAITAEEFRTIWEIFRKYECKAPLEMD